ncbi:MAG: right-handed parallel beta-helix repeat-containing protein [Bacteroidota bacterium]|nr:right-handed parallel beta-helix repeat-containing protein [Bacteroidota bacterium]
MLQWRFNAGKGWLNIENCKFTNNQSSVHLFDCDSATIRKSSITANDYGIEAFNTRFTIDSCLLSMNEYWGLRTLDCKTTLKGSTISYNEGKGLVSCGENDTYVFGTASDRSNIYLNGGEEDGMPGRDIILKIA